MSIIDCRAQSEQPILDKQQILESYDWWDNRDWSWEGPDHYYHSEHYFHSGYVNNVIIGLVGLRPRVDDTLEVNPLIPDSWDYFALDDMSYHGHRVSVVWDRSGEHYGRGSGLMLFVDGEKVASSEKVGHLKADIEPVDQPPLPGQPVNFAVNNGRGFFPYLSASHSHPKWMPQYANDSNYWYLESPGNRWTSEGSESGEEWKLRPDIPMSQS